MHVRLLAQCFVLLPAACLAQAVEFEDDFSTLAEGSDGAPRWQPVQGRWAVRDGAYEQTDFVPTTTTTFLTEPVFADFAFTVRFRVANVGGGVRAAGLIFRSVDSERFYYVHYDTRNSQVILVKQTPEKPWGEIKRVGNLTMPAERWHEASVQCEGETIRVFLTGKRIIEARDSTFKAGRVGLRCGQGRIAFDDVSVKGTAGALEREWTIVPGPPNELDQPRLTDAEHIVAEKGGGYFPVMIRLKDGRLGAGVRGGAPHGGIEGRLDWIASADGGKTWSEPSVIVDSEYDDRNPALGQMPDGTIVCAYAEASTYNEEGKFDTSVGKYEIFYVTSNDGGATWSEKKKMYVGPIKGGSPFGKITVLRDGTAIMPLYGGRDDAYTEPDQLPPGARDYAGIVRSHDNGETWEDFTLIAADMNETSIVEMPDGRLIAVLRTDIGGSVWQSESSDKGYSWTAPRRVTRDGQHPADITLLQSGHLLITYGHRLEPYGCQCMLSRDGGKTWDRENRTMVGWTSLHGDCGYPSTVQLDDGTIVTMYYSVGTQESPDVEQALVVRYTEDMIGQR
ncbi:MAG: sialidase family protein [Armatimonadota bacterium]